MRRFCYLAAVCNSVEYPCLFSTALLLDVYNFAIHISTSTYYPVQQLFKLTLLQSTVQVLVALDLYRLQKTRTFSA